MMIPVRGRQTDVYAIIVGIIDVGIISVGIIVVGIIVVRTSGSVWTPRPRDPETLG
jgi:hypothetical protein